MALVKFTDLGAFNATGASRTADVLAIVNVAADTSYKITPSEFQINYIPRLLGTASALDTTLRQVQDGQSSPALSQFYIATDKSAFSGSLSVGQSSAPAAIVDIKGAGSTGATKSLQLKSSSNAAMLTVFDSGSTYFGTDTVNGTFIDASGNIFTARIGSRSDGSNYMTYGLVAGQLNILFGNTSSAFFKANSYAFGAGATQDASAVLEAFSTTKGFLPPRMTEAQKNAISSPAVGLIVYQTDATEGLYVNKSGGWTFII